MDKALGSITDEIDTLNAIEFDNKVRYVDSFKEWIVNLVRRNLEIKKDRKVEKQNRKRQSVYCLDFGVNVGSEFNYFHFCVVIKEFDYTAIIVPLSTEKEDDAEWKSAGNLVIPIGIVEDMRYDKKPCYAMVNQIKTVSKQRLTDYYDNANKDYVRMMLNPVQTKLIYDAIHNLTTQEIFTKKVLTQTV